MLIDSGTGNGFSAGVDNTNKLQTRAVTKDGALEASIDGNAYALTSGSITLTSATSSAVLWFQNEEEFPLIMERVVFGAGVSTGGTGPCTITSQINPTGLGSGSGTEVIDINSNIGSTQTLTTSESEIGQQGATITGGTSGPAFYFPTELTSSFNSTVTIPKGSGIAFAVIPPTGNTSLAVSITLNVFRPLEV